MSESTYGPPELQCGGKMRHETWTSARREAKRRRQRTRVGKLEPYRCDYCKGFHVGHARRAVRREEAA